MPLGQCFRPDSVNKHRFPNVEFWPPQDQVELVAEVDDSAPDSNRSDSNDFILGGIQPRGFQIEHNQTAIREELFSGCFRVGQIAGIVAADLSAPAMLNPLFDLFQHVSCLKVRVGKSLRASAATAEPA